MPTPPSDATTTLAELKTAMADFATAREWEQFHSPKNLSMAIAAEAAELMEHFLWCRADAPLGDDEALRHQVAEELADIVLLSLQFANRTGIDVSAAVTAKLAVNAAKYPVEKARGVSTKYTKL